MELGDILPSQVYKIVKLDDLEEVNKLLVDNYEMKGYIAVWEFLGCGSETVEPGVVKPFYILGQRLYSREYLK